MPFAYSRAREPVFDRRSFIKAAAAWTALAASARIRGDAAAPGVALPFANGHRELVAYPQKRPLIRLTSRPPQLETPFSVFNEGILTPNDAFFVRYHFSQIPTSIDPDLYRLHVKGLVGTPLTLSLEDLRRMARPVSVVAVNQCSGNGRGFFSPRVPGGQLANGAMGNARWTGIPLKAVLEKAGVQAGAKQVSFRGLDHPPVDASPPFVKALDIDHALDGEVMIAYAMNGEQLPMLNGFPLRLVVPGYYGTYWIKHLSEIEVLGEPFKGFWMSTAYRIPDTPGHAVKPGESGFHTIPINRMNVRSFITSLADGDPLKAGDQVRVRGIAFDGGSGIKDVFFSSDSGATWRLADLGKEWGRYSFREWAISYRPASAGEATLQVRAVNRAEETQPLSALWNPSGYMRNVVESLRVRIT